MLRLFKSWIVELLYILTELSIPIDPQSTFDRVDLGEHSKSLDLIRKKINSIMLLLRRTPSWAKGHLRLGLLALSIKEIELAFASFQAARTLGVPEKLKLNLALGLSGCFLARSKPDEAIKEIHSLPQEFLKDRKVIENLAACYMVQEKFIEAQKLLSEIPENQRTAEISVALESLRRGH